MLLATVWSGLSWFLFPYLYWVQRLFAYRHPSLTLNPEDQISSFTSETKTETELSLLQMSQVLAISGIICALGGGIAHLLGFSKAGILVSTVLIVALATGFPQYLGKLSVADKIGTLLMQIFFAVIGASANIGKVIQVGPILFVFAALILSVQLVLLLLVGRLLRLDLAELLIACNANIGGPTTAAAMASAKEWDKLVTPAILAGTFGYAIATFIAVALANWLH